MGHLISSHGFSGAQKIHLDISARCRRNRATWRRKQVVRTLRSAHHVVPWPTFRTWMRARSAMEPLILGASVDLCRSTANGFVREATARQRPFRTSGCTPIYSGYQLPSVKLCPQRSAPLRGAFLIITLTRGASLMGVILIRRRDFNQVAWF